MKLKQLIGSLPDQVVRELLGTFLVAHYREIGCPSPEAFLALYPKNVVTVETEAQFKAVVEAFENKQDIQEAVAAVQASEAITKAKE
jgi:hypothetical protein